LTAQIRELMEMQDAVVVIWPMPTSIWKILKWWLKIAIHTLKTKENVKMAMLIVMVLLILLVSQMFLSIIMMPYLMLLLDNQYP
jgi:hypothetical protein